MVKNNENVGFNLEGDFVIVLATPVGGKCEHRFKSGRALAEWCWKNAIHVYRDVPKDWD